MKFATDTIFTMLHRFRSFAISLGRPAAYHRGHGLFFAWVLLSLCLFKPSFLMPSRVNDWLIVLDITQSMNVRDYTRDQASISRLEYAKAVLHSALLSLPCGSRVSLAMFTERNTLNVVRPMEVCAHFSALDQTLTRMDWRMAWAADSFIAHGVYSAIELAAGFGKSTRLLFITDGQQAPPANPRYMPTFSGKPGQVRGYLLGAGKPTASPIPKLDDKNGIAGYWDREEALRYGSFGMAETLSVLAMEQGQHDRNAGHGAGQEILSQAHLSGLDEQNLQKIAKQTGLGYQRLESPQALSDIMNSLEMADLRQKQTDMRPWLAIPALLLILYFIVSCFDLGQRLQQFWIKWPNASSILSYKKSFRYFQSRRSHEV